MTTELGTKVRDTMTGFTGIAIASTTWLHGCVRITIQPERLDKDGKVRDTQTFDEPQVELVAAEPSDSESKPAAGRGGPKPRPVRRRDPVR